MGLAKEASLVKEINVASFEAEGLKSDVPVVVDFWAPWCGPCKALAPLLEGIASNLSGFMKFVKVNVDGAGNIARKYGISSIPTLVIFQNGSEVSRGVGGAAGLRAVSDFVTANYAQSLKKT